MKKSAYLLIATCAALMSCTEGEEFSALSPTISNVKQIVATIEPFIVDDGVSTRTTFNNTDGKFYWAATDTIGIFPNSGDQVSFPIKKEMAGQTTVDFNGGGWDLKADSTYFAYFPFSRKNFWGYKAKNEVKISFLGQKQKGKDNADFADTYPLVSYGVNNNGNVHFGFKHMASIAVFTVTAPKPATFTKAVLTTEDGASCFIQEGTYDLSKVTTSSVPAINAKSYGSSITLNLESVTTTTENESFKIFITVPPTSALTSSVKLILTDSEGYSYYGIPSREIAQFVAGTRYQRDFVLSQQDNNIIFADPLVKEICVANWDYDGDGELSFEEAKSVREVGYLSRQFAGSSIKTFNELKYFSNLTNGISFGECSELEEVTLPNSITTVDGFYNCVKLKKIVLPENATSINWGAFRYCASLTDIIIPQSITSIGPNAFEGCTNLRSIIIPQGVEIIENTTFEGCINLSEIIFPEGLTKIDAWAFGECKALKNIILPESLTTIGGCAFASSGLETITIPKNVSYSYDGSIFQNCENLNEATINSKIIFGGMFSGCSKLERVVISDYVEEIGAGAFDGCKWISKLVIPESVKSIGNDFIEGCTIIESITCKAINPPTIVGTTDTFYYNPLNYFEKIYVPAASVNKYKTARGWSNYADLIVGIE